MKLNWKVPFIGFLTTVLMFVFSLRSNKSPYPEFESKLKDQICECIALDRSSGEEQFLVAYEKCTEKTSELLKTGLNPYLENPAVSKEEYLNKLEHLILKFKRQCRR